MYGFVMTHHLKLILIQLNLYLKYLTSNLNFQAELIFKSIAPDDKILQLIPQNESGFDALDNLTLDEQEKVVEEIDFPASTPICRPSAKSVPPAEEVVSNLDKNLKFSPDSPLIDSDTEHDHLVEAREFKQEENANNQNYDVINHLA